MLVFNCTRATAEFFTLTDKGDKIPPLAPAPEKAIAESLQASSRQNTSTEKDIETAIQPDSQWHWLVHTIKIKRKNVVILMDYHSRFAMTFTGLKKGDDHGFLKMFERHLRFHIRELLPQVISDPYIINTSFAQYGHCHAGHVFYRRGDRSVQSHINDVGWHIEMTADEMGELPAGIDLIAFDCYINNTLRSRKGEKNYFVPLQAFLHQWLCRYSGLNRAQADKRIKELQEKEKARYQAMHNSMFDVVADSIEAGQITSEVEAMLTDRLNDKPATGDANNVIQVDFAKKNLKPS
ncbi:hypothetical protein SG34_029050 [Thalassomonas viridans]|uniref:DUF6933 domain-containing protein n=1 Tax=Thalassomonas viridans TaxID=137584 RepID=A0AAE9Z288_9GAMM|nr:hypothetical protein [Thalassomonas viridans]WDE05290.1 hypothetical protein SG34_029050 [Thalassomonas viridans]